MKKLFYSCLKWNQMNQIKLIFKDSKKRYLFCKKTLKFNAKIYSGKYKWNLSNQTAFGRSKLSIHTMKSSNKQSACRCFFFCACERVVRGLFAIFSLFSFSYYNFALTLLSHAVSIDDSRVSIYTSQIDRNNEHFEIVLYSWCIKSNYF